MGLLDKLEQRNFLRNPDAWVLGAVGGTESGAGVRVTEDSALEWTALAAAIRVLSNTIAGLPLNVYMRLDDEGKELQREHPLFMLLHDAPNDELTAFEWRQMLIAHAILWGNAYTEIVRDRGGRVKELWPINPDRVKKERKGGTLRYIVSVGERRLAFSPDRILHVPGFMTGGLIGRSLAVDHKEAIGLGLATEIFSARFFGNDASPGGALVHPETLSEEAQRRLKTSWEDAHRGLTRAHRVAVLEEGMKWMQIGTDPDKAQLLGARTYQVQEAARITGVPPHLIGDLSRATFSNIEEQSRELIIYGLQPWITRTEQRMRLSLLTEAERKAGLFIEHQIQGLMRGDTAARSAYYQAMLDRGVYAINEVRRFENLNKIDNGDTHFVRMDMIPLDRALEEPEPQPDMGEPPPAPDEDDRSTPRERRSPALRLRLTESFTDTFRDAADRLLKREMHAIRAQLQRTDFNIEKFRDWLQRYYFDDFPPEARKIMWPVFRSYAEAMAEAAYNEVNAKPVRKLDTAEEYVEGFSNRHSRSSRLQLEAIVRDAETDGLDPIPLLEGKLEEWEQGTLESRPRHERVAGRELVQLGSAVAVAAFASVGVVALRWVAFGDSCPMCEGLNGRVVGMETAFVQEGETFSAGDKEITPKANILHPPLHAGCDCMIVPEAG